MINLRRGKDGIDAEVLARMIWVSTFLAMIFTLPALGIFLGVYHWTGSLWMGAAAGFPAHFVALAFSGRISRFLTNAVK